MFCGYIYCITNTITNKKYIGKTADSIMRRYKSHIDAAKNGADFKLSRSIRKHGVHVFEISCLYECEMQDKQLLKKHLSEKEIEFIAIYNTFTEGYNMTTGGEGGTPDEEARKKLSIAGKGRKHTAIFKKYLSQLHSGNKYWLGKHHTVSWKIEMRERMKGENNPMFGKIGNRKGACLSEETKRKISDAKKGCIPWNKGIPRTDVEKATIREALQKRKNKYLLGGSNGY